MIVIIVIYVQIFLERVETVNLQILFVKVIMMNGQNKYITGK